MTEKVTKTAREIAHDAGICQIQVWQCSGCRVVFFGLYRSYCPCGKQRCWSGSVDPVALAAAQDGRPHTKACDAVTAAIAAVEAERDEARDWVRRLHSDAQTLTCVYCGQAYPPGTPASGSEALTAHVEVCPKHPLAAERSARRKAAERERGYEEAMRLLGDLPAMLLAEEEAAERKESATRYGLRSARGIVEIILKHAHIAIDAGRERALAAVMPHG